MLAIFLVGLLIGVGLGIVLTSGLLDRIRDIELNQAYTDGLLEGGMFVGDLEIGMPIGHAAKFAERN